MKSFLRRECGALVTLYTGVSEKNRHYVDLVKHYLCYQFISCFILKGFLLLCLVVSCFPSSVTTLMCVTVIPVSNYHHFPCVFKSLCCHLSHYCVARTPLFFYFPSRVSSDSEFYLLLDFSLFSLLDFGLFLPPLD